MTIKIERCSGASAIMHWAVRAQMTYKALSCNVLTMVQQCDQKPPIQELSGSQAVVLRASRIFYVL